MSKLFMFFLLQLVFGDPALITISKQASKSRIMLLRVQLWGCSSVH
jgi:hypothetical protein